MDTYLVGVKELGLTDWSHPGRHTSAASGHTCEDFLFPSRQGWCLYWNWRGSWMIASFCSLADFVSLARFSYASEVSVSSHVCKSTSHFESVPIYTSALRIRSAKDSPFAPRRKYENHHHGSRIALTGLPSWLQWSKPGDG